MPYFKKDKHEKRAATDTISYWLFGKHAAVSAILNPRRTINKVLLTRNAHNDIKTYSQLELSKISNLEEKEKLEALVLEREGLFEFVSPKYFQSVLPKDAVHQGIALEVMPLKERELEECKQYSRVAVLDQVTDPHNVGAIMRSSLAFGIEAIIMHRRHSPDESAVLAKTASGALEVLPLIWVQNLAEALRELKDFGFFVVGLDGEAPATIDTLPKHDKVAIVMGAEGKGLRQLTGETCDMLVKLPISDKMESLNVSNAAAVAFYALQHKAS